MCNKKAIDYAEERGHHETVMILNDAYKRAAVNEKHIAAVRDATQIVQCEYKCGYSAPQDLITHHEDHECPERLAYCHDCEAQIMAKLLETHMVLPFTAMNRPVLNVDRRTNVQSDSVDAKTYSSGSFYVFSELLSHLTCNI